MIQWQRCVRNSTDTGVADNTQHHIIKDSKRTADDAQLIQHIHTCILTVCGFGLWTEAPQGFAPNKNCFVFVCFPKLLAVTCKQEFAFGCANITNDNKEASKCT